MSEFPTVDAYRAARQAGDTAACSRLVDEVNARFATRTTDGREIAAMFRATLGVADDEDLFPGADQQP